MEEIILIDLVWPFKIFYSNLIGFYTKKFLKTREHPFQLTYFEKSAILSVNHPRDTIKLLREVKCLNIVIDVAIYQLIRK